MLAIKKEYVVTYNNKKKAVLLDIDTFNKMEEIIESYGLAKYMAEVKEEESLSLSEAKRTIFNPDKGQSVICQFKKVSPRIFRNYLQTTGKR